MAILSTPLSCLLFCVVFHCGIFHCLYGDTRVKIKVKLKEYEVNGKDWHNRDCDIIINKACDPMFLICLDKPSGDSNPNNCGYTKKGWSDHYQGHNSITFGNTIGDDIDNPIETTARDWTGSFRFKVHVKDHDVDGDDEIDKFNYRHYGTPAKSSAVASWSSAFNIYGTRSRDKSRLKIQVLLYCEADWYSTDCSVYCKGKDDDTDGHYTCDSDTGEKICRAGWETPEENCLVKENDCEENNCLNGATCVDHYQSYTCDCMDGFTGAYCETDIDECASNPCQNGGQCLNQVDYFHCVCSDPYTGDLCQHHVCSVQDYCENGGTCYDDGLGNVSCICTHPYIGRHCDVDKCDVLQCENGGVCVNGSCDCPPDYLGNLCEFLACDQIVCDNGGTCVGDACVCPSGYTGRYCHIYINFCESEPCQNEGSCEDYVNGYQCKCLPGYNGTHCEQTLKPTWEDEGKALGQVTSTDNDGTPGWSVGLSVAVIAFVIVLVIAIAVLLNRRRRRQKATHAPPTVVTSDTGDQSSFPNPLYNTDLGQDASIQTGGAMSSIETTAEKVPFPDMEKTMSPPPPYTPLDDNKLGESYYAEVKGSVRQPPGYYSEVMGLSTDVLPSYGAGASAEAVHYDNPRKLTGGSSSHYDNPKELLSVDNNNESHYQVPSKVRRQVCLEENGPERRVENEYASISGIRHMASAMDDSIHNNSTNEMLERDNGGFEEN